MNLISTDTGKIRKFGVIAFVFFGSLCALALWRHKPVTPWFFGLFSFLGIACTLFPTQLNPIYDAWLKLAHFSGRIITALILALAYYTVITPSAGLKRLLSGAPLPVKPDKKVASYWVARAEPIQPRERFLKRY
jgi:hypothetical protein